MLKMADYFKPEEIYSDQYEKQAQAMDANFEELAANNEKEILKNVDINFLFAKGYELSSNLIDMNRVYLVVSKIK